MRKDKIKFKEVDDTIIDSLLTQPDSFFSYLKQLSIKIPVWSKIVLIVLSAKKKIMVVNFFESAEDFFLSYTKKILRYSTEVNFICFSNEYTKEWRMFIPPTLIGINLTTKLRRI